MTQERQTNETLVSELARARSRSLLTHSLLHDFGNAMGGAGSLAEAISEGMDDCDALKEDLVLIRDTVYRGQEILKSLVELNRETTGETSCFNLVPYLEHTHHLLEGVLPRHSVLKLELPTEEVPIKIDPLDLRHVLILILGRCRKKGKDPVAAQMNLSREHEKCVIKMTCGDIKADQMAMFKELFTLEDQFISTFARAHGGSFHPISSPKPGYALSFTLET